MSGNIFKMLFLSIFLGYLLMIKLVYGHQGFVDNVAIDAKITCPSKYKLVFSMPSEIQCVQRCLTRDNCADINCNEGLKTGDNCEIYDMPDEERYQCHTVPKMKGWKSSSLKKAKENNSKENNLDASKDKALGFQNREVADYQLSSSPHLNQYRKPAEARLNNSLPWCAYGYGVHQFLRVDFEIRKSISAVALQGDPTYDNWVTSYKINFTQDGYIWQTYQENRIDKVFVGPTTRDTPVMHQLNPRIRAFGVLINPKTFYGPNICLRVELYGQDDPEQPAKPDDCMTNVKPLGMASMSIPNSRITASSVYNSNLEAHYARLNHLSCWIDRGDQNGLDEYLQVDFGVSKLVFAIATQGQFDYDNWVTSYEVLHSKNGTTFQRIMQSAGVPLRFSGNSDRNSIVKNKLQPPILARYIRINPKELGPNSHDYALRCEFYGCNSSS